MSQELADRLAVAAGWRYVNNFGADLWHKGQDALSYAHPFPVGRIDPILDLMRESGLDIDYIHRWDDRKRVSLIVLPRTMTTQYHCAEGPDLWTALASAVLGVLETKA